LNPNLKLRRGGFETLPYIMFFLALLLFIQPTDAQDAVSTPVVTADDVNTIAHKMYCPVCENIPLDVCPTLACAQWRDEIKAELQAGQTEEQIVAGFVARYGDRVVGTPQDPTLRALSLVTPWLIAAVSVLIAGYILIRWWRGRSPAVLATAPAGGTVTTTDDEYRARLERDLQTRR
jgi:cytochrome c-type biogenesis protein CcmH